MIVVFFHFILGEKPISIILTFMDPCIILFCGVCMSGFCNVCVCEGFVMCVYEWVL